MVFVHATDGYADADVIMSSTIRTYLSQLAKKYIIVSPSRIIGNSLISIYTNLQWFLFPSLNLAKSYQVLSQWKQSQQVVQYWANHIGKPIKYNKRNTNVARYAQRVNLGGKLHNNAMIIIGKHSGSI